MSQFQENFQMEGRKDGRTDPNSKDPSGHSRGYKNSLITHQGLLYDKE